MRKDIIILSVLILLIAGCAKQEKSKNVLAKFRNYQITVEEFDAEFRDSPYARTDTPDTRKEFLNMLVNRKLILQDAQAQGLDKDEAFLKSIEKFWEQSLLKIALEKKSRDIAGLAKVSDKSIEEAYQKMLKDGKTDKTYDQMYSQIKWEITKLKESKLMSDWLGELYNNANVEINYRLLNDKVREAQGK